METEERADAEVQVAASAVIALQAETAVSLCHWWARAAQPREGAALRSLQLGPSQGDLHRNKAHLAVLMLGVTSHLFPTSKIS